MKLLLFVVGLASVAYVYTMQCHHDDASMCTGMTCTNAGEAVKCEHEVCTCGPAPGGGGHNQHNCTDKIDCENAGVTCDKHGEHVHCVDRFCNCIHNP